ncbi:MAG: tetratricopeptide repeat protein [Nitrospirae bacterium]|nr:tetratricopeptide repeat protein [Nitrospirota bacterium]
MLSNAINKTTFFLLSLLLFVKILFPSASFADAGRIFKENNKAVVVVVAFDEKGKPISQGSGFIVRHDGAIVTNYHVISNAKGIAIKASDKVLEVEGFIYMDKENDLVILKAKAKDLPTVKIGDINKTSIGEKVYVISSPEGLENTISDGILSGIRDITSDKKILQITAPVSSGSSGGPVFNKNGEVIGIATFIIKEAQNLNFAMPVELIKNKIENKKVTALKDTEIREYKETAEYWFYLGVAYSEAGMHKEAAEAYKQAIRIKPDDAEPHYNLGGAYGSLGMYKEAINAYKQAIRVKPDYAKAHYNLGITYGELGMYREAIEAFKQAIRIKPDYAEAHYNLGVAYGSLDMYKEAINAYKQAIRIKPDYAKAHYNLGITYLILNNRGSALEEYKILKDLDKESANKLFNAIYK